MPELAMLDEIDRLPGAECGRTADDRHPETGRSQHGPNVRGHIVGTLRAVAIRPGMRGERRERIAKIAQHVGIGILLDGEGGRGVGNEDG